LGGSASKGERVTALRVLLGFRTLRILPRDVTVIRVPYEPVAATLKLAIQLIQHEVRGQGRDGALNAKDNFCSGLGWASRYSVTGYDLRMVRLGGEWHVG